jgi:hypothetical protein
MRQSIAVAAIFIAHAALFTLIYYGRQQGVPICDSDMILFGLPFLFASWGYAVSLTSLFRSKGVVQGVCLSIVLVFGAAFASTVMGMFVAFNLMGT